MSILGELNWIDWTSLAIGAYFLVMGLFRGFLWQASRLVSFVLAYVLASLFATDVAGLVERVTGLEDEAGYYAAYFTIFIAVIVVLSILTILLDKFVKRLELSFYNHLGGGVLGIATAAALIVGVLGLVYRILPESGFVAEAKESRTGNISRFLVDRVGLPPAIRSLYEKRSAPEEQPIEKR